VGGALEAALHIRRTKPDITGMTEATPIPARKCPICGKPAEHRFRPFCSRRCADVDLNRWFSGTYSMPAEEEPDFEAVDPDEHKGRNADR
jgi:uncharacterized protein